MREIGYIRERNGECDVTGAIQMIKSSSGISRAEALADRYIKKRLARWSVSRITGRRKI